MGDSWEGRVVAGLLRSGMQEERLGRIALVLMGHDFEGMVEGSLKDKGMKEGSLNKAELEVRIHLEE